MGLSKSGKWIKDSKVLSNKNIINGISNNCLPDATPLSSLERELQQLGQSNDNNAYKLLTNARIVFARGMGPSTKGRKGYLHGTQVNILKLKKLKRITLNIGQR